MDVKSSEQRRFIKTLPSGWEVRLGLNGRVYYLSHRSHTVQILPPPDSWSCLYHLSYGWELALDYEDKPYFINHVLQQVTYADPRTDNDTSNGDASSSNSGPAQPLPREYTINRDEKLGYGFIAGSEKPVIVRSVTAGGPSDDKLLPGDQIIMIGDELVASAPREKVISLIKDSKASVTLTVIQPAVVENSSFLKPSKKLLKGMNRHRVRFAENNDDNQENPNRSSLLIAPNVLRVYLGEGQSHAFEFNNETTAGDIVVLLCEELGIEDNKFYSLILKFPKSSSSKIKEHTPAKLSDDILIPPWDLMSKVLGNPSIKHHECHFRMAFVAKDVHKLSREDPKSFNYFYQQCVNDIVEGELYRDDLSVEEIFRLASLHILLVSLQQEEKSSNSSQLSRKASKKKSIYPPSKFALKVIEKEFGLARFLPPYLVDLVSNQSKEHRKTLQQCIKASYNTYIVNGGGNVSSNSNNKSSSPPQSPSACSGGVSLEVLLPQLRLQYIKSLSHFHLYGGRYFEATILAVVESDIILLVGHHYGISQLIDNKNKMASIFADFSAVKVVEVAPQQPGASKTNVKVDFQDMAPLVVSMGPQSALDFAHMISGYCRVHGNNDMMLTLPIPESASAPKYFGPHQVKASNWNYPVDADSSSTFHCDFSEPLNFSLLSDQVPESVRAMFQQSRIMEESNDENHGYSLQTEAEKREMDDPNDSRSENADEVRSPVDEGVAMVTVDGSPKSSTSSMISGSPSSGIGSSGGFVRVREDPTNTEVERFSDQKQPRTSNASSGDAPIVVNYEEELPSSYENFGIPPSEALEFGKIESSLSKNVHGSVSSSSTEENVELQRSMEPIDVTPSKDSNKDTSSESSESADDRNQEELEKEDLEESGSKNEATSSKKASAPPVPESRHRFSSFKPDDAAQVEVRTFLQSHDSPTTSTRQEDSSGAIAGKAISSDEFQARLRGANVATDLPPAHLEGDAVEIATSPLPVTDLAQGHKSLKSDKKKNRFSWGGSLARSQSSDHETEKSKKRKSLLRGIFSTRRAYSMEKDKRKSTLSLEGEPERKKKWRFFGIFRSSSSSPKKKSRFSIFGRKKRSHDLNISASPHLSKGAYSSFEVQEVKKAASVEDMTRREKEVVETKPRPVSFMTFQRPPSDEESDEYESPEPLRKGVTDVSLEENTSSLTESRPERTQTPPPNLPEPRSYHSLSLEDQDHHSDNYVIAQESDTSLGPTSAQNDYESLDDLTDNVVTGNAEASTLMKVKRKAPSPPPLPPSLQRQSDDEAPQDQDDLYETPDAEPIYEDADMASDPPQVEADTERFKPIKAGSISSVSSSDSEQEKPTVVEKLDLSRTSSSSSEDQVESSSKVALEPHEVQVIQDDFSSSFPSLKASTDDLTTQIFSVLEDRNSHQEEEIQNSSVALSASDEEDLDAKEVVLQQDTKTVLIASNVDAVLNDQSSTSEDSDRFAEERKTEEAKFEKSETDESADEQYLPDTRFIQKDFTRQNVIKEPAVSYEKAFEIELPPVEHFSVHPEEDQTAIHPEEDHESESNSDEEPVEKVPHVIDGEGLEVQDSFESDRTDEGVAVAEKVAEPDEGLSKKPDRFANVLNRLLINGLEEKEPVQSNPPFTEKSTSDIQGHFYPREEMSSSFSSDSSSDEERPTTEKIQVELPNSFDEVPAKSEEMLEAQEISDVRYPPSTDVIKIEPVLEPTASALPAIIPPPAEFDIPAIVENHADVSQPFENCENSVERVENSPLPSLRFESAPEKLTLFDSNSNSAQNDDHASSKSSSESYHNLIAPRLFGQQRQWRPFSKVKPPTSFKASPRPAMNSTPVAYPGFMKNGHPSLPPKPKLVEQSPS